MIDGNWKVWVRDSKNLKKKVIDDMMVNQIFGITKNTPEVKVTQIR